MTSAPNRFEAFKESDIRPEAVMAEQADRYARDVQKLLEHKDDFVETACPACGGHRAEETFRKYSLRYVRCRDCGTLYVTPRPTPELLARYYATSENYAYWNRVIFPASEPARREKIFRPRAERILELVRRHNIPGGVLLDVGAGFGTFCEETKRLGYFNRVIAVEPTPDLADTCRQRGLDVVEKAFQDIEPPPGGCAVITAFEVIEHLFSPADFIRACRGLLFAGGLLVLTCPNIKGFDIQALQALSHAVDTEHLNYFTPSSLAGLAGANGFEVLEVQTPGRLDAEIVRKAALAGKIDLSNQPFLRCVLIDEWEKVGEPFQRFLADQQLSSHLWLAARKRDEA